MMGFLSNFIADARPAAPESSNSDSGGSFAEAGISGLNPVSEAIPGMVDTAFSERPLSEKRGTFNDKSSVSQQLEPSVFTAPSSRPEAAANSKGQLSEVPLFSAPLMVETPEIHAGQERQDETIAASLRHENGIPTPEEIHLKPKKAVELSGFESPHTELQAHSTCLDAMPGRQGPDLKRDDPLPLTAGQHEHEPPSDDSEVLPPPASYSATTDMLVLEQNHQSDSVAADVSPFSNRSTRPFFSAQSPDADVDESNPEQVVRPIREFSPNADNGTQATPKPVTAQEISVRKVESLAKMAPGEERSLRETAAVQLQEMALATQHRAAPSKPTPHLQTLLHRQERDSSPRAKVDAVEPDTSAQYPLLQGQRNSPSAFMNSPQPTNLTPEVKIGQVDVFIEGPSRSSGPTPAAQRPTLSLASRHYLRRI